MYGKDISVSTNGTSAVPVFSSPPAPVTNIAWQGALVINPSTGTGFISFDGFVSDVYLPASMGQPMGIPCNVSDLSLVQIKRSGSTDLTGVSVTMVP